MSFSSVDIGVSKMNFASEYMAFSICWCAAVSSECTETFFSVGSRCSDPVQGAFPHSEAERRHTQCK